MAAPEYVPRGTGLEPRIYESPQHVPPRWEADRPSEVVTGQPSGGAYGHQGPDLGYVYTLLPLFDDRLRLVPGEDRADVDAGCCAVAMKRSSLFGRAPVVHDLEIAYRVWGFLDDAPAGLIEVRRPIFEGVAHPHHYGRLRALTAAVPEATLRLTPRQVADRHRNEWSSLLDLG